MNIVVPMQQTVDLVEELELNDDGTDVEREYLKFVANEWDEQALEEALLLKEAAGGTVTVVGIDETDVDGTLFAALAKGADRAVKLSGDFESGRLEPPARRDPRRLARRRELRPRARRRPEPGGPRRADGRHPRQPPRRRARVGRDRRGAARGRRQGQPGVRRRRRARARARAAGRSSASRPRAQAPRYVSISARAAAMQAAALEETDAADVDASSGTTVRRLYAPESTSHAEMLGGRRRRGGRPDPRDRPRARARQGTRELIMGNDIFVLVEHHAGRRRRRRRTSCSARPASSRRSPVAAPSPACCTAARAPPPTTSRPTPCSPSSIPRSSTSCPRPTSRRWPRCWPSTSRARRSIANTTVGMDVAGGLSARAGVPLVAYCTAIDARRRRARRDEPGVRRQAQRRGRGRRRGDLLRRGGLVRARRGRLAGGRGCRGDGPRRPHDELPRADRARGLRRRHHRPRRSSSRSAAASAARTTSSSPRSSPTRSAASSRRRGR